MTDKTNPHSDKGTEERKADELAAQETVRKEAEAVAAKEAAVAAAKTAAETSKDLPKEEEPKEEPSKETPSEEKEGETPLDTTVFGDTGSEVGNSVLQLLQNAGATPDEAKGLLFEAVQKNDMGLIDETALVAKVGEASAKIILSGAKTFALELAETNRAAEEAVYSVAGNAENWTKVQTWAEKAMSDAEMADYNALISKGGASARFAATELLTKFNGDKGNTQITDTPRVDADVDTSSASEATTSKEYFDQMVVAKRKGLDTTAIKAARARGRAKGLA
jgi:hypothetical protein